MKESINQEAVLEDVEESVFLGFCEFAYRGFYVTPRLKEKSESNDPKKDTDAKEDSSSFTTTTLLSETTTTPQTGSTGTQQFGNTETSPPSGCQCIGNKLQKRFLDMDIPGTQASKRKSPDIMFHAKLCVFATRYLIDKLRFRV